MTTETMSHQYSNPGMPDKGNDSFNAELETEFQGEVRLRVEATDQVRTVMLFVSELRQKQAIRVLELKPTAEDGIHIRVALPRSTPLLSYLSQNEWVSKVEVPQGEVDDGSETLVHVQLVERA